MSEFIMLHPRWASPFHRTVKDEDGNVTGQLVFNPQEPKLISELTEDEQKAITDDIGRALVFVRLDKTNDKRERIRVLWDETDKARLQIDKGKQKAEERRVRAKRHAAKRKQKSAKTDEPTSDDQGSNPGGQ